MSLNSLMSFTNSFLTDTSVNNISISLMDSPIESPRTYSVGDSIEVYIETVNSFLEFSEENGNHLFVGMYQNN